MNNNNNYNVLMCVDRQRSAKLVAVDRPIGLGRRSYACGLNSEII